jgi:ectoine hydroxylase-related dioxygenase (phytanoyl-CoA dioxygenase family)
VTPPLPFSSDTTAAAKAEQILETFRREGIAVVPFTDLFEDELWREAVADITPFVDATGERAAELGKQERAKGKEEVIVRRFFSRDEEVPCYFLSDVWLRIASADPVLDIVNGYTGQLGRLTYVDNWFTVPYPQATKRVASQRWHRDPEDDHIVKMFVYFSDVDEEAGPFEYVRDSAAGGKYGDLFPWGEGHRYPAPEELEAGVDPDDRLTMTGPAGTVIFCDTAGFHRGGFARTKPRILMISTFLRESARKDKRRFEVDFEGREDELSAAARHALAG